MCQYSCVRGGEVSDLYLPLTSVDGNRRVVAAGEFAPLSLSLARANVTTPRSGEFLAEPTICFSLALPAYMYVYRYVCRRVVRARARKCRHFSSRGRGRVGVVKLTIVKNRECDYVGGVLCVCVKVFSLR